MKNAAQRLATIDGVLALLGLPIWLVGAIAAGCAAGSDNGEDDGGTPSVDAGAPDVSVDASDASPARDAGASDTSHEPDPIDASDSAALDADSAETASDSAAPVDAADGASAVDAADGGPRVVFGSTCPAGTVYNEPFTTDPIADGTFTSLIGPYSYSAINGTLSLTSGSPNTQLWIGPRPSWTNYTITVPVRLDSSAGNGGITFRMVSTPASPGNNAGQMYYAGIATNQVMLGIENGDWHEFTGPSATFQVGTFYTLEVTASGSSLSVSVNGVAYATNYTDATYSVGSFGLRTYSTGMTYGAIKVTCN